MSYIPLDSNLNPWHHIWSGEHNWWVSEYRTSKSPRSVPIVFPKQKKEKQYKIVLREVVLLVILYFLRFDPIYLFPTQQYVGVHGLVIFILFAHIFMCSLFFAQKVPLSI